MNQYELIDDMYNLIFNELDYYGKWSYARYLTDEGLSRIDFLDKNESMTEENIVQSIEYGIDTIKNFLLYNISEKYIIIEYYIGHFVCITSFEKLINIFEYKVSDVTLRKCIDLKNKILFKYIHKKYKLHYEDNIYSKNTDLKIVDYVKCNTCLREYNQLQSRRHEGNVGLYGSKGSKRVSLNKKVINKSKNGCKCGNCKHPRRIDKIVQNMQYDHTQNQVAQQNRINQVAQQNRINQVNQVVQQNQVNQINQVAQQNQVNQINQVAQQNRINQVAQQNRINQVAQQNRINQVAQQIVQNRTNQRYNILKFASLIGFTILVPIGILLSLNK